MFCNCTGRDARAKAWLRKYRVYGEIDDSSEEPGFGCCLWNIEGNRAMVKVPSCGADTAYEVFKYMIHEHSCGKAVGWRTLKQTHEVRENGGNWEKLELENSYNWITYREYGDRVRNLGSGLAGLGLLPKEDKVVLYAETQKDWMISAFAAWQNNNPVVTIYATLGEEGAQHGINQTNAVCVFTDARLLQVLVKILPSCPSVKHIVIMGAFNTKLEEKLRTYNVTLNSIYQLIQKGKHDFLPSSEPKPEDTCVIMYTSGTTGNPKGVVIKHSNICAVVAAVEHHFKGILCPSDVYLAYLPLAHIMELAVEVSFMSQGVSMGFGTPQTLTDSGIRLKKPESRGDAPLLEPTAMIFAPAVLDKVYVAVQNKVASKSAPLRTVFNWGVNSGKSRFDDGQIGVHFVYKLAFKTVQKLVGGKLKWMITGSAPLSPDIQKFVQAIFNCPVRQGYGLTETCCASAMQFFGDNSVGSVGPPTVSNVIRLADWPEGNYQNADKDNPSIGMRRGEILIGGPTVTQGYFIDPSNPDIELMRKNKDDWIDIQGIRYFRSGDIGQIQPNGTLQVIDRKKDLWKGPNGEYVALTKVEAALMTCEYTEVSMCFGKTGGSYPVALLCPRQPKILALGKQFGVKATDFSELCKNEKVIQSVTKSCQEACRQQNLVEFEIPKKIGLVSEMWTPENNMLTAAMKLKRPMIVNVYKAELDTLYA